MPFSQDQIFKFRASSIGEDYPFINKIRPHGLKKDLIINLLSIYENNYQITRDKIHKVLENVKRPWDVLRALKKGDIFRNIMFIARDIPSGFDFCEKFPEDKEVLYKYVISLFNSNAYKEAAEIINSIASRTDFSEIVRNEYSLSKKIKPHVTDEIRKSFPDFCFD